MAKRILWLIVMAACGGGGGFHLPMSAAELGRTHDARALALYLSQPGADPTVCDASAPGPHAVSDDGVGRVLVDALRARTVRPAVWRACVDQIFASAGRGVSGAVLDDPALEADAGARERLAALAAAYSERPPELRVPREAADALVAALRARLGRLGAAGRAGAQELIATLDLERGRWGERVVDAAFLDERAAQHDEALLARFAARLPDAGLRGEAARRVIRLRIAASPFAELRDDAAHVEELVLRAGINPVSPRLQRPMRATVDAARLALPGVRVDQQVVRQTARLGDPRGAGGLLGRIALRGALAVEVDGLTRPITLCGAARELDPTPCLLPGDVAIDSPLVWRDPDGGVHFVDDITESQAVELARNDRLALPIAIAGAPLAAIELPLAFAAHDVVVYDAATASGDGPALQVDVEQRGARLIYQITSGQTVRRAVVERAALRELTIVSRGRAGSDGSDGSAGGDGSAGSDGAAASCPSSDGGNGGDGGDGDNGADGGSGGNGGNGGTIHVTVRCDDGECQALVAALREVIRSEGGAAGSGGRGGAGGRGGHGGSAGGGTSCTDDAGHTTQLSSGFAGRSGSDGRAGSDGASGASGAPGTIEITPVKR